MAKTTQKPKKKYDRPGRPSKFDELSPRIPLLARRGFTDKEIATTIGITEQTLNNWKKAHPEFFESLKDWKSIADNEVERSLYERACGYSFPSQTIKKKLPDGKEETIELTKHKEPDPTSMIFWLKNRKPLEWRDKTEHEVNFKGIDEIVRELESEDN